MLIQPTWATIPFEVTLKFKIKKKWLWNTVVVVVFFLPHSRHRNEAMKACLSYCHILSISTSMSGVSHYQCWTWARPQNKFKWIGCWAFVVWSLAQGPITGFLWAEPRSRGWTQKKVAEPQLLAYHFIRRIMEYKNLDYIQVLSRTIKDFRELLTIPRGLCFQERFQD